MEDVTTQTREVEAKLEGLRKRRTALEKRYDEIMKEAQAVNEEIRESESVLKWLNALNAGKAGG